MSLSNYIEEDALNHYLRGASSSVGGQDTYLAIFDGNATEAELEDGTLTNEITGYDGDRPRVDDKLTSPSQQNNKAEVTTDADIDYQNMPETTVKWAAIMDAATGGNVLAYAQSTNNGGDGVEVSTGATFRVEAGDFTFDLD